MEDDYHFQSCFIRLSTWYHASSSGQGRKKQSLLPKADRNNDIKIIYGQKSHNFVPGLPRRTRNVSETYMPPMVQNSRLSSL